MQGSRIRSSAWRRKQLRIDITSAAGDSLRIEVPSDRTSDRVPFCPSTETTPGACRPMTAVQVHPRGDFCSRNEGHGAAMTPATGMLPATASRKSIIARST
ncbi:hypothetical protein ABH922_004169 [Rhodococcus sp. 27YEA15]